MKRCPRCTQTFNDEYLYCLTDGTPLTPVSDPPEERTFVTPRASAAQPAQPVRRGVSPVFAYLSIALLASAVGGAFVLWLKSGSNVAPAAMTRENANAAANSNGANPGQGQDSLSQQQANLQEQQAALEREKQRLADERRMLEAQKNQPLQPHAPTAPAEPTERITFHKGSVQETIYGSVATERAYVLRARSGQYLSASVSSPKGCVVFSGGSTNTTYTTTQGDNSLTLRNNCAAPTSYTLTVYVQ